MWKMLYTAELPLSFALQLYWESKDFTYLALNCNNIYIYVYILTSARLAREIALALEEMKSMEVSAVKAASAHLSPVRSTF